MRRCKHCSKVLKEKAQTWNPAKEGFCNIFCRNADDFWGQAKKLKNGCWEWQGTISKGYGIYRGVHAHRYAYQLKTDEVLTSKDYICHKNSCHNRRCINIDHLYKGTIQSNNKDHKNYEHKELNDVQKNLIRETYPLLTEEFGYLEARRLLARHYDVLQSTITKIVA